MSLRGFQSFDESGLSEVLTDNLIYYLDYGFVEKGGYTNVQRSSNPHNNQHILYPVRDIRETNGTVWATRRKNWVWEPNQGIPISGVWVNNNLITSGYEINYRDGYIKFNSPISTNSQVELNYSYKYIQVFDADESRIFQNDTDSFNVSDNIFINGSGFSYPDKRIQLPAIGLEVLTDRSLSPFELGNLSQRTSTTVLCNILSTDDRIVKRISDYLSYQQDKSFYLFDRDMVAQSGFYPMNYDGTINNPSGTYPYLAENFKYKKVFAAKVSTGNIRVENVKRISPQLYHSTVRMTLNCIF